MSNLVMTQDKEAVTSSFVVADSFNKSHFHVLRDIRKIMAGLSKLGYTSSLFVEETYINEQNGQEYPVIYMNRDGFMLTTMGFGGEEALKIKLQYIDEFNRMEQALQNQPRLQTRPVDLVTEIDHIEAFNDKPIRVVAYHDEPAYCFLDIQRAIGYRKTASRLWREQKPMKLVQIKNSGQYNGRVLVATINDLQELAVMHTKETPQLISLKEFIKVQQPKLFVPVQIAEQIELPLEEQPEKLLKLAQIASQQGNKPMYEDLLDRAMKSV